MSPGEFVFILKVIGGFVMLFQLRFLMQSANVDYYHPFSQIVIKLTNPLVNIPGIKNIRAGNFMLAGLIISFIIAMAFWLTLGIFSYGGNIIIAAIAGLLMTLKCFGILLVILLLVQALCSWLPATQNISYMMGQITYPIVGPVQRVIPTIGMIDISLMIVMIALFALNTLIYKFLLSLNPIFAHIWYLI